MKWNKIIAVYLVLIFISCGSKSVDLNSKDILFQQLELLMRSNESVNNYKSVSFSIKDTQFLAMDDQWEFSFYYLDLETNDTLLWDYKMLTKKSKEQDFGNSYSFVKQEKKLLISEYYGRGYLVDHFYIDSISVDTFKVLLEVDTNMNIKSLGYYDSLR